MEEEGLVCAGWLHGRTNLFLTVAEASFSNDENNGAALMSVSLPSLVLAAVLAKVYAH